jgi:ankyrin repeat protein
MRDFVLGNNPSVDQFDEDGKTPLMLAAQSDLDTVKLLVGKGADVDKVGGNKDTPLTIASAAGEDTIVEYLLSKGADPTRVNDDMEQNALMTAAWGKGNPKIATKLLDPKAKIKIDVNKPDKYKRTALFLAARSSNSGFIKELIKHPKIDVNQPDDDGFSPFIIAAKYADDATVTALVSSGKVKADATTKQDKRTALMVAAFSKPRPAAVFQAILSAKPALDLQDQDGNTALMLAVMDEHEDAVKALLGAKAKKDIKNKGETALDMSIKQWGAGHAITKLLQAP